MAQLAGPQNPTPTSTLVRAGNRLTRVSQLPYLDIAYIYLDIGYSWERQSG